MSGYLSLVQIVQQAFAVHMDFTFEKFYEERNWCTELRTYDESGVRGAIDI